MSTWVETSSPNFSARFDDTDRRDVRDVLNLLEDMRERLASVFPVLPDDVSIVLHTSRLELDLAQPYLPILRRATTPAARRYVAGWAAERTVH
ncbi:MAG: hypothetical protein H0W96_17290, partial [Solirubrobacterales bacterium]|nr:hypothetical protein [Solirubrobacterales bacterium]